MTFKIDKKKSSEAKKIAIVKAYIKFLLLWLLLGYGLFYTETFDFENSFKIIFFIFIIVLTIVIDAIRFTMVDKEIRTTKIKIEDDKIIKIIHEKEVDSLRYLDIDSLKMTNNGLIVNSNSHRTFFIPKIIENIDEIKETIELKCQKNIANRT